MVTMTPHRHLRHASSASDLSTESRQKAAAAAVHNDGRSHHRNGSKDDIGDQPRKRSGLLSKLNKLVQRNPSAASSTASAKSSSSTAAAAAAEEFKIVHEPDVVPIYSPRRPVMPRTSSEYQEALEEMYTYTSSPPRRPSTAPESAPARSMTMPEQRYVFCRLPIFGTSFPLSFHSRDGHH